MDGCAKIILHVLRLLNPLLTMVIVGLMCDFICVDCINNNLFKNQFVDFTMYAYLIIHVGLAITHFKQSDVPWFTLIMLSGVGILCWLISGVFICEYVIKYREILQLFRHFPRAITAGILCIVLAVLHIVESFILYTCRYSFQRHN